MKQIYVTFINKNKENDFEVLKKGKFESKEIHKWITRVIERLKFDPRYGIKIPRNLWPRDYLERYTINNLWKCDLPKGNRLTYTLFVKENTIVVSIIEWMTHKEYEKRFNY